MSINQFGLKIYELSTKGNWLKNDLFTTALVTILCFCVSYFYFGFYYVDYEGLFDALYSGKLTEGVPFRSIYFLAHIGTSFIYSSFYESIPNIEWLSIFLYLYLFIATFLGLYLTSISLPRDTSTWIKITLQIVIYWLIFADHYLHFIFTRVSFMLTGLSLISLIIFFPDTSAIKHRKAFFLLLNLLLTLGILTRVESATATISFIAFFAAFQLQNIRHCIRLFLYPSFLILTIISGIAYQINNGKEFYLQIEPDIEVQYGERQNIIPLSAIKNHKDSLLYTAAYNMMWSDPNVISPLYLRSLIKPEKLIFTDIRQWNRTSSDLFNIFHRYRYLIFLNLIFAIILYSQRVYRQGAASFFYWLAFESSFWILNIIQTYTAKINDRSFAPYLCLFLFCHIILLLRSTNASAFKRKYLWISLPVFFVSFVLHSLKIESNILKEDLLKYKHNFEKIKQVASKKYLILNSSSVDFICLCNNPFHPFDFSAFKRIYITDGAMIPFLPYYKKYLEQECKCDIYAFPSLWNHIVHLEGEQVIISNPNRMQLISDYLKEFHQFKLTISPDTSVSLLSLGKSEDRVNLNNLKVYTIIHKCN